MSLDQVICMIFLPFCQAIHTVAVLKCERVTRMTCSTCTCHENLSCSSLILCYFKSFIEEGRWESIFFVLSSSSSENLISERLGICNHVRRPVSGDRRLLLMEREVGIKAVYCAYSTFTTDTFAKFLYYKY